MLLLALVLVWTGMSTAEASQPLETETARLLPRGVFRIEQTSEFQTSSEGTERAFPFAFTYGITDRTEILVEPVVGTSIRPKNGPGASGAGDLEITLTHRFIDETPSFPAFALAAEVKLPTARNDQIGTGKTDYTVYAIASKRIGRLDTHVNLGYTIVGEPAGISLNNILNYAWAEEYHATPRFDIVGEITGNTSATGGPEGGEGGGSAPAPPEVATSETAFMIGARYYVRHNLALAFGVAFDNNHTVLFRPGITYRFGK